MKTIFHKSKHPGYVAEVVLKESYDELQKRIDEAIDYIEKNIAKINELLEQEYYNKIDKQNMRNHLKMFKYILSILRGDNDE